MKIVFMGTPHAAVESLDKIVGDGHEIVAVYTQPDKPAGRGKQISSSPVKQYAIDHSIPVHSPSRSERPMRCKPFGITELMRQSSWRTDEFFPKDFSKRSRWVRSTSTSRCFRNFAERLL